MGTCTKAPLIHEWPGFRWVLEFCAVADLLPIGCRASHEKGCIIVQEPSHKFTGKSILDKTYPKIDVA